MTDRECHYSIWQYQRLLHRIQSSLMPRRLVHIAEGTVTGHLDSIAVITKKL